MFKHLIIITDAEITSNSLHLTDRERAEALIALLDDGSFSSEISEEVKEAMLEADEIAAEADYTDGAGPKPMAPEDYIDTIRDVLSNNDVDIYIDDLYAPVLATSVVADDEPVAVSTV